MLSTPALTIVSVFAGGGEQRRLMSGANLWALAQARVQSALQTFQSTETNQLAGAVAIQLAVLPAGSAAAASEIYVLLQSLTSAASQAVLASGFVCEALGAAAVLAGSRSSSRYADAASFC